MASGDGGSSKQPILKQSSPWPLETEVHPICSGKGSRKKRRKINKNRMSNRMRKKRSKRKRKRKKKVFLQNRQLYYSIEPVVP